MNFKFKTKNGDVLKVYYTDLFTDEKRKHMEL